MTNFKLLPPKMTNIFQRFVWETRLLLLVRGSIPQHRIIVNHKIKLKVILVSFLPSLILFYRQRRQVNGVRRRTRSQIQKPSDPPIPTTHHITNNQPLLFPVSLPYLLGYFIYTKTSLLILNSIDNLINTYAID